VQLGDADDLSIYPTAWTYDIPQQALADPAASFARRLLQDDTQIHSKTALAGNGVTASLRGSGRIACPRLTKSLN